MFVARSKRAAFIRYRRTFSMRRKLEYMRVSKYLIMLSIFCFFCLPFYLKGEARRILGCFQGRFDVPKFQSNYPFLFDFIKKEGNLIFTQIHGHTQNTIMQKKEKVKRKKKKKRLYKNQIKKNEVLSYKSG